MASGWGNLFASLGDSADRRMQMTREDAIRAQDKIEKDRQFKLMMDQFLANQAQQERSNKLQEAGIAAANMRPDIAGGAGTYDEAQLKKFIGTPYEGRITQGMTLPATTMNPASYPSADTTPPGEGGRPQMGAPMGTSTPNPSTPTGKFVWNPTWEQQHQLDEEAARSLELQQGREFQTQERMGRQSFETGQEANRQRAAVGLQESQQKFLSGQHEQDRIEKAREQGIQLAGQLAIVREQLGPKLSTQQQVGIHLLEQASKSFDPDEQNKLRTQAFQLLGIKDPMMDIKLPPPAGMGGSPAVGGGAPQTVTPPPPPPPPPAGPIEHNSTVEQQLQEFLAGIKGMGNPLKFNLPPAKMRR